MPSKQKQLPPISILRERFYLVEGELFNRVKVCRGREVGAKAGKLNTTGYLYVCIGRSLYLSHRVIYAMAFGVDPFGFDVDHIDGNSQNNLPSNLRLATRKQNMCNRKGARSDSTTGFRNVEPHGSGFRVRLKVLGKSLNVGTYKTEKLANAAAILARQKYFGEFAGRG